jgi:formiminoglutamase
MTGFPQDVWTGRTDVAESGFSMRWHQAIRPLPGSGEAPGAVLVGFACDAGVRRNHGRAGAALGPHALRTMLANVTLQQPATLYDAGDVGCDGDALEEAQDSYAERLAELLARDHLPIGLGGGHEIAWAAFQGLANSLGDAVRPPRIGIINLDAHFDLRAGTHGTSGTPFRQIAEECAERGWPFHYACFGVSRFANTAALFERARSLGVRYRLDEQLGYADLDPAVEELESFIAEVEHVYLTVCLDVLPPDLAPGVSAPSARGVSLDVIERLVDVACASGKLRVADVAELNPVHDIDGRTARVAARLVARIASEAVR